MFLNEFLQGIKENKTYYTDEDQRKHVNPHTEIAYI